MNRLENRGWQGQALLGALLGLVWVPCVGPTLGAASLLAAQGESLAQVMVVMSAFGIGAATPLVLIGLVSGAAMVRLKGRLGRLGRGGKQILGASLLALGLLIITDYDRSMEIFLTEASPDWLLELTTRF
jgi:cytochrome c biogenesis protein CcdA